MTCLVPPGDYSALSPPPNPNETPPNLPPPSMTFELPITYTHLGVYFGTSGSNMKQLCKEHDVKVHLGPIKAGNDNQYSHMTGGRNRCSHLTGEKFEVTITGGGVRERNDFLAVQKEMLLRAQLVCGKREKHREHVSYGGFYYCREVICYRKTTSYHHTSKAKMNSFPSCIYFKLSSFHR